MKEADGKEKSIEAGEQEDHGQVRDGGLTWAIRGEGRAGQSFQAE